MTNKRHRSLSFTLKEVSEDENHVLPINAMQFSSVAGRLYTASRDGTVKEWRSTNGRRASLNETDSQFEFEDSFNSALDKEFEEEDFDERILKLETAISSSPLTYPLSNHDEFKVSKTFEAHFDWINDIKLVNNEQSLVTCSSDLSLKILNLHEADTEGNIIHKFTNVHTDYIKKITHNAFNNQIMSGGLDGKIVIWDLETLTPVHEIKSCSGIIPNSVYSLANNYRSIIASGGPSNTIDLYDTRSQNSSIIKKLIGHHGNVRSLLMNENYILSASSDTTIKLWDLRNFKLLRNFGMHDVAVWSLSTGADSCCNQDLYDGTQDTHFKHFYSGDKAGNIIKTDLTYILNYDSHEEDLKISLSEPEKEPLNEDLGLSILVAQSDSPIISLCVELDSTATCTPRSNSIVASTFQGLSRFYLPETSSLAEYQFLSSYMDCLQSRKNKEDESSILNGAGDDQTDLNSDFYDLVSHLSLETSNQDLQSSFSYSNALTNRILDGNVANVHFNESYSSMFLDSKGGPSHQFFNAIEQKCSSESNTKQKNFTDDSRVEIFLNPIPADFIDIIPFNISPFEEMPLIPKDVIAKNMLNNKRHVLALYSNGDIKLWDLVSFSIVKSYLSQDSQRNRKNEKMSKDKKEKRIKEMDEIFEKLQTQDVLHDWCEVEIRSGKLMVTVKKNTFGVMEIYFDDLCSAYPFLSPHFPENKTNAEGNKLLATNDLRYSIAQILICSLFQPYALYEWDCDQNFRESLSLKKESLGGNINVRTNCELDSVSSAASLEVSDPSLMNSAVKKLKVFGRKSFKSSPKLLDSTGPVSRVSSIDGEARLDARSSASQLALKNAPSDIDENPDPDSVTSLLLSNKHKYEELNNAFSAGKLLHSRLKVYSNSKKYSSDHSKNGEVYKPCIPSKLIPQQLLIIISEYSSDFGNMRDVFSFHFNDMLRLINQPVDPASTFINDLRLNLPIWIGEPLLLDKFTAKEFSNLDFQLVPCDYSQLSPSQKIGGKSQKKIKKLPVPEAPIKLSSHGMLRVVKILAYLLKKFEAKTQEMKDGKNPEDWLVLECKGQELPPHMTIQTIKTRIWKSGSEMVFTYRQKFDA